MPDEPEPEPTLMTVAEVAAVTRSHEETVRTWLRDGRLRGFRVGSTWRIPREALGEFIASGDRVIAGGERDLERFTTMSDAARPRRRG